MTSEDTTAATPESVVRLYFGDSFDTLTFPQREGVQFMVEELLRLRHILAIQESDRRSAARARDISDTESRAAKARQDDLRLRRVLRLFVLVHSLGRDLSINDVAFVEDVNRDVAGELVRRRARKGDLKRYGKVSGRGSGNLFRATPRLLREHERGATSNHKEPPRPTSPAGCRIEPCLRSRERRR